MPADCSLLMLTWNSLEPLKYYCTWYRPYFDDFHVLDHGSTDGTREFLTKLGAVIHEDVFENFAERKNYLTSQARHDWVFHLDADEAPECSFLNNLEPWISPNSTTRNPLAVAFKFPRVNYGGRDLPDWQIRLYDRKYCEWKGNVHEIVVLKKDLLAVDAKRYDSNGQVYYVAQILQHGIIHDIAYSQRKFDERQERWKQLESS